MWSDFKKFAFKGNVLDLAVGVVIGAAFGKIVTSIVNDIIMPLVGLLLGNVNFSNLFITLGSGNFKTLEEAKAAGVATVNYGLFLNNILDFIIVAFAIYIVIEKLVKMAKRDAKVAEATTKKCPFCMSEIHLEATRCPNCTSELEK